VGVGVASRRYRRLRATPRKCPDPRCQPTDLAPFPVEAFGPDAHFATCGGRCATLYPKWEFRKMNG